ncbi:MAG TPA: hemolysin family protein [Stellaceae bacterium]|nr:hemolysin family protein [Stellaceae bacterium]
MLWLQLAVVLLLILLNGFFALAEMAVISARKARLQHAAELGRSGAQIALELKRDPGRFLSTVQVGITVIGVLASVFGGHTLAETITNELTRIPGWAAYAGSISFVLVVVVISYLTLILGELVPKRIALGRPELIAARLSAVLRGMARLIGPIEWVLSASSNLVLRLVPSRTAEPAPVTDEEISLMLREATAAGHFEATETAIVQMALRLGDRRLGAMMTPRTQVEWLDLSDSDDENRRKIRDSAYSRFPVVVGGAQQMVGVVQVKDLLSAMLAGRPFDIRGAVKPPLYLPDTVTALRALELFKQRGEPMAMVVDEYGDFEGIVTLHDILQSLVGDIAEPGEPGGAAVVRREDGSFLVDGMMPIDEVTDLTGLAELPGEASGEFHTLGGFVMARINRIPAVGDRVLVNEFRFEVVSMDGRRVDRVLIIPPGTKQQKART